MGEVTSIEGFRDKQSASDHELKKLKFFDELVAQIKLPVFQESVDMQAQVIINLLKVEGWVGIRDVGNKVRAVRGFKIASGDLSNSSR